MRVFKNIPFKKWAKKEGLTDTNLKQAVKEIERGLVDASLSGNILKKRVSVGSQGKRSGARTILAYKVKSRVFFLYGFSKNKKSNITLKEEKALKLAGEVYLNLSNAELSKALQEKVLFEVDYGN